MSGGVLICKMETVRALEMGRGAIKRNRAARPGSFG
jgi:hypothetical protein